MDKNQEKSFIKGLSLKRRIILKGKRIVMTVPNKLSKLRNGSKKILKGLLIVVASPVILPVIAVKAGVKGINTVASKAEPYIKEEIDAYSEKKFYQYGKKLYNKEEQLIKLENNIELDDAFYNIYRDAYLKDIEVLKKKQIKVATKPNKIALAGIFVKKMTTSTGIFFKRQAKRVSGFTKRQCSRATGFVNRQWLKSKKFVLRHTNAKKNELQNEEMEQIIDETNYVPADINGLKNKIVYLINNKQPLDENIAIMYQDYCKALEDLNDAQSELGQSFQEMNRIKRELEQLKSLKSELKQQVNELIQQLETEKIKEKVK